MARGRKKKIIQEPEQNNITDEVVEKIISFVDSGEKDENDQAIFDAPLHVDPEVIAGFSQEIREAYKEESDDSIHRLGNWDILASDKIEFFDPELSYELTGYRPITETKGLDFNPDWFTEARKIKIETGKYCSYPEGGKKYMDFWKEQFKRCNEGYTVNGYTITGDNYFFLNFYRLQDITSVKFAGAGRKSAFPNFYSKQYEYFHYIDLCEKSGYDVCALKARGVKSCPPLK